MDKKQFATFAMALKTYYPKENLLPNDKAMELWFKQLQDIPYEVAEIGLNKWVSLNKWSPSISEIRGQAKSIYFQMMEGKTGREFVEMYQVIKRMEKEENQIPANLDLKMLEVKEET